MLLWSRTSLLHLSTMMLLFSVMLIQVKRSHGFGAWKKIYSDASKLATATARQDRASSIRQVGSQIQMVTNIPKPRKDDIAMDTSDDDLKWQYDDESLFSTQPRVASVEDDNVVISSGLKLVHESFDQLSSGTDIRGSFVNHGDISVSSAVNALQRIPREGVPASLTPLAAFCMGYAFAKMVATENIAAGKNVNGKSNPNDENDTSVTLPTSAPRICIGRDPRPHGSRLADGFARGAKAFGAHVKDTGLASTPAMFEFCRSNKCDGGVMITASHLPADRNGFKLFTRVGQSGFSKDDIKCLIKEAKDCATSLFFETGNTEKEHIVGSGSYEKVNYMPHYAETLRNALINEVCDGMTECSPILLPLAGLRIVLNAGYGAGGFFNNVLHDLGADVTNSVGVTYDSTFPNGIPNPEDINMVDITKTACENCNADIGIMLDTDADRCGFIVPRIVQSNGFCSMYDPLNRNRLIAFLGVIFYQTSPGCTIVTDSCTSEGLQQFLEQTLGLHHERYIKGYANVIGKAKELSEKGIANAEVAIETSGHCAMKENGYLDDGTYTAVKVIGCLAKLVRKERFGTGSSTAEGQQQQQQHRSSLLELISDLPEMSEVCELRLNIRDGTLDTTTKIFDDIVQHVKHVCIKEEEKEEGSLGINWKYDDKNLEGVRARIGSTSNNDGGGGGFFMIRKSLHDPIISIQLEGFNRQHLVTNVIQPLIDIFYNDMNLDDILDISTLQTYAGTKGIVSRKPPT